MWIVETLQQAMVDLLSSFVDGLIDKLSSFIDNVFILMEKVVQGDFVSKVTSYSYKLGIAILIFLAIAQIIKLYILNESGEPEDDVMGFFIRLGKSAILMSFSTVICEIITKIAKLIGNDLIGIVKGNISVSAKLKADLLGFEGIAFGTAITLIILLVIAIILILIICFQAGLRGVNLAILQMVAPLFATNYITTDKGLWRKWLQSMASVSFTYTIQLLLVNIGMKYIGYGVSGDLTNFFVGFCWLVVCIQSPKILKEFAYASGVGSGVSRGTSTAISVATRIMK